MLIDEYRCPNHSLPQFFFLLLLLSFVPSSSFFLLLPSSFFKMGLIRSRGHFRRLLSERHLSAKGGPQPHASRSPRCRTPGKKTNLILYFSVVEKLQKRKLTHPHTVVISFHLPYDPLQLVLKGLDRLCRASDSLSGTTVRRLSLLQARTNKDD